jgi:hypothetical protein
MSYTLKTNASFSSAAFMEQFPQGFAVEPDTGVEYSVTHIPGGSTIYIQSAGQAADTLDLPIVCTAAALASLRSKARSANRASLIWHRGTEQARLMKVKSVRKAGPHFDLFEATLELIMG